MSLTLRYEFTNNSITSIGSNRIRFGQLALSQSAEVGEPTISQVMWDDPDGEIDLVGFRQFSAVETAAPSNNQHIGRWRLGAKTVTRGPSFRTGVARRVNADLADYNALLGWRLMMADSAKRPAETASDRLTWLINTRRAPVYAHPSYCSAPSTAMDAADYRGQRYADVLADIANTTGYNFWCEYDEGRERSELFFMNPGSSSYTSTLSISNDLADVDSVTVFAPSEDAELRRDPSRVTAGAYVAYDGGYVYETRDSTGDQFAYVDQTAPLGNVKSATKARAIATRYLDDNDEEDDRITCSIIVPAASVNAVRAGHRIPVKFTHFPGYEDYRYCRVLRRTVVQEEELGQDYYRILLDLSPTTAGTSKLVAAFFNRNETPVTLPSGWTELETIAAATGSTGQITLAYGPVGASSVAFFEGNGTNFNELAVGELAGFTGDASGATSVDETATDTTCSINVTASGAGIILAAIRIHNFDSGARTLTKPSGFVTLHERMNASGAGDRDWGAVNFGYKPVSAAGTYTLTWEMSNQFNWPKVMAAVFIPAGDITAGTEGTSGMVQTQTVTATLA